MLGFTYFTYCSRNLWCCTVILKTQDGTVAPSPVSVDVDDDDDDDDGGDYRGADYYDESSPSPDDLADMMANQEPRPAPNTLSGTKPANVSSASSNRTKRAAGGARKASTLPTTPVRS